MLKLTNVLTRVPSNLIGEVLERRKFVSCLDVLSLPLIDRIRIQLLLADGMIEDAGLRERIARALMICYVREFLLSEEATSQWARAWLGETDGPDDLVLAKQEAPVVLGDGRYASLFNQIRAEVATAGHLEPMFEICAELGFGPAYRVIKSLILVEEFNS